MTITLGEVCDFAATPGAPGPSTLLAELPA